MEVNKEITIFDMAWRLAAIVTRYRWPKRIPLESSDGSVGLVDFGWANFWSPATVVCQNMEGKDLTNISSLKNGEVSGG